MIGTLAHPYTREIAEAASMEPARFCANLPNVNMDEIAIGLHIASGGWMMRLLDDANERAYEYGPFDPALDPAEIVNGHVKYVLMAPFN